ncbi:MAG: creatininase family protein [Anaerolineae bacterium]|nr:creatininase family protein [Thermoflexales bacterium]MDW8406947.1 creatininase family protein [Anaerolineae bacterium]
MQWENLTASDFAAAVQETGVCVLALGVLEQHSEHLPLGTDMLVAHRIACLAAAREPAIVFPPFYFGQIYEAQAFPGAIALRSDILLSLLHNVLDEIGRNGFRKIILYNGHGGNHHLLRFLAQCSLAEPKPYSVYVYTGELNAEERARWQSVLETSHHGHACGCETSLVLAGFPDLVHLERVPAQPADPLQRMSHLPDAYAGIWWYADYPTHYAGDARPASAEKGRVLEEISVSALARFIAAVKADDVVPALEREFFSRRTHLLP